MRAINCIVLHCTASPQTQTVKAITDYWKNVLGWKKPGYHHLISADGTDNQLLPISEVSNGVQGFNSHSIHISYIGGVDSLGKPVDNRTEAQKLMMEILVRNYHAAFPDADIKGHRDFSVDKNRDGIIQPSEWMKTCPSFSVAQWVKEIKL